MYLQNLLPKPRYFLDMLSVRDGRVPNFFESPRLTTKQGGPEHPARKGTALQEEHGVSAPAVDQADPDELPEPVAPVASESKGEEHAESAFDIIEDSAAEGASCPSEAESALDHPQSQADFDSQYFSIAPEIEEEKIAHPLPEHGHDESTQQSATDSRQSSRQDHTEHISPGPESDEPMARTESRQCPPSTQQEVAMEPQKDDKTGRKDTQLRARVLALLQRHEMKTTQQDQTETPGLLDMEPEWVETPPGVITSPTLERAMVLEEPAQKIAESPQPIAATQAGVVPVEAPLPAISSEPVSPAKEDLPSPEPQTTLPVPEGIIAISRIADLQDFPKNYACLVFEGTGDGQKGYQILGVCEGKEAGSALVFPAPKKKSKFGLLLVLAVLLAAAVAAIAATGAADDIWADFPRWIRGKFHR